jgi:hypothetical protein
LALSVGDEDSVLTMNWQSAAANFSAPVPAIPIVHAVTPHRLVNTEDAGD